MSDLANMDWPELRALSEKGKSPEWLAEFGEAAWEAALLVSGELSPGALAALTPEERAGYALGPVVAPA